MSHAPTDTLSRRHAAIRAALAAERLDALVVTALPNILYLTNFTGSSAIVVVTADRLLFLTDFRYVAALADTRGAPYECPGLELVTVDGSYDGALGKVLSAMPSSRVGFEAAHLSVGRHQWLMKTLAGRAGPGKAAEEGSQACELVPVEGVVERARLVKDGYELGVLREAASRLTPVADAVFREVRRGRTELEIAARIDWLLRDGGFSRSAFETIVAAGPNGALPHARPGRRRLIEGDVVVLDFGGVYDSYCVDLSRTVIVGTASARAREVYRAVLEAHDRAVRAVAPGRSRFDIDAAARGSLAAVGMAEAFGHGTGHGLGIEVHEDPRISRRRPEDDAAAGSNKDRPDEALRPGMVFTIEPGVYFPGWGGVRIEDDVAVTEAGVELLTHVTTDLLEL
jgi:Xaa-Pro aminopeptidase